VPIRLKQVNTIGPLLIYNWREFLLIIFLEL